MVMTSKAFFVLADVLFAALVASLSLVIVHQTLDVGQADVWKEDALHKMSEDILLVLDKNGTVAAVATMSESAGETTLTNALRDMLPRNFAANITFVIYEDDDDDGNFTLRPANPVYSVRFPVSWDQAKAAVAKRVYAKFDDKNPDNNEFGVVEIRLWTVV